MNLQMQIWPKCVQGGGGVKKAGKSAYVLNGSPLIHLVVAEGLFVLVVVCVAAVVVGVLLLEPQVAVQADVTVQTLHSHPLMQ